MKKIVEKVCTESQSAASTLRPYNRQATGHPSSSKDQSNFLSAIVNIVQASTTADDCRHTETLCTVKALDDLHADLKKVGFNLSWSTLYLWLLPRRGGSIEWKRHVETVPVKVLRPDNNCYVQIYAKSFIDDMFIRRFKERDCYIFR